MNRRRLLIVLAAVVLGLAAWITATRGPQPPTPNLPGTFSFAALGDAPYYFFEDLQYRVVLQDIEAHPLSLVVHIGDLFWTSCTSERYRWSLDEFNGLPHPLIYTPGDNEWTDCWAHSGDFTPLDRLAKIREIFFDDPSSSLGGRRIPLEHQGGRDPFAEYVENARWVHEGIVFATFHLVGSGNGTAPFPARTEADDAESKRRTEAATAWLLDTFAQATSTGARAVVLAFHANPEFEGAVDDPARTAFEPFIETLEEQVALFRLPVLAIHGDWHDYTVDRPLIRRSTGRPLENFTRLQVPGSFDVGWVRVIVTSDAVHPFAFEARVIPRWKYW